MHKRFELQTPVARDALRVFTGAQGLQHRLIHEQVIDLVRAGLLTLTNVRTREFPLADLRTALGVAAKASQLECNAIRV